MDTDVPPQEFSTQRGRTRRPPSRKEVTVPVACLAQPEWWPADEVEVRVGKEWKPAVVSAAFVRAKQGRFYTVHVEETTLIVRERDVRYVSYTCCTQEV